MANSQLNGKGQYEPATSFCVRKQLSARNWREVWKKKKLEKITNSKIRDN